MCHKIKIITKIKNGELSFCEGCNQYTLQFNNLCFQFDKNQLLHFRSYISKIDVDYWLNAYSCTTQKRKIHVNTLHQNLVLIFNKEEMEDLRGLLMLKNNEKAGNLSAADIDYPLILN